MSCGRLTSKCFLTMISLIYWAVAAALIFVSVWIFMKYENVEQITKATMTSIPAAIIMATGFFMFILGIVGCVAAFKENRCLLGTLFILLLCILLGMIVAAVLAWVYRQFVTDIVSNGLKTAVDKYDEDTGLQSEMDFIQSNLKCCGRNNYTDWKDWSEKHEHNDTLPLPASCCSNKTGDCLITEAGGNHTNVYQKGCMPQMHDWLMHNLGIILGVAATLAVIQLLGLICSCILFCHQTKETPYIGLQEERGYRV